MKTPLDRDRSRGVLIVRQRLELVPKVLIVDFVVVLHFG
jgi:hypothetical protein